MTTQFTVETVLWESHRNGLLSVRHPVFVVEQKVPLEIEEDDRDPVCVHVLARDGKGEPIGTARLDQQGKIGRVAVLKEWRKQGVGAALMRKVISIARADNILEDLNLHAQTWTVGFYESLGFEIFGGEFEEAGIPHIPMKKSLVPRKK